MADNTDIRHMVMSFRVSELQVLLGFAGRNKSGRKQELVTRALSLVEKGCSTPIQIKIRELYRRRFPPKASSLPHPVKSPPHAHTHQPNVSQSSHSGSTSSSHSKSYNPYSSGSHSSQGSPSHNQVPVNPDVKFKLLAFYDKLGELLKPSSLVPRNSSRFQETFFVFHLTPHQAQEIGMSRDLRQGMKCDYSVQVQLRFCLLETSCEQEDNFPPSICVRVNGKMAPLPSPIPTNKPGVEPKRPSRPVNITSICRISPTVPNHINISWASELGRSYCVAVYLVRRLTSDVLLSRLKQNGARHPDHTRALIKEKLTHDPDSEIATTSLRVSLMCPLGKMRMSIPSRAATCSHLQCFDAPTYLQMNEKKPTWTCPVCDRPAEFDRLFVDGLFSEIIKEAFDQNEIQFGEDGSWSFMKPKEERPNKVTESPPVHTVGDSPTSKNKDDDEAVICIDLTETDDEGSDDDITQAVSVVSNDSNSSSCSSSGSSSESDSNPIFVSSPSTRAVSSPSVISAIPHTSTSHASSTGSTGAGGDAEDSVMVIGSPSESEHPPVLNLSSRSPTRPERPLSDHSLLDSPPGSPTLDRLTPPLLIPTRSRDGRPTNPPLPSMDFARDMELFSFLDARSSDSEVNDFLRSMGDAALGGASEASTSGRPQPTLDLDTPYNFRRGRGSSINYCEIDSASSSPEIIPLD